MMKVLIPIFIGLLVVGCGQDNDDVGDSGSGGDEGDSGSGARETPEESQKELTLEEKKAIGTYELKQYGSTFKGVFLENGVYEDYVDGSKKAELKWKISIEGEIHIDTYGEFSVMRINKDGSITDIAEIHKDGQRTEIPKKDQDTWIKIK